MRKNGKKAALSAWHIRATVDAQTIDGWFGVGGDYEDHNIGVLAERRVFLDVDLYKTPEAWTTVAGLGVDWQATPCQRTPGGGLHLLYDHDAIVTSTVGLFPGVDIRSGNAYIVGAPSTIDGKAYELVTGLDMPLSYVPTGLATCLIPFGSREAAPEIGEGVELDAVTNVQAYIGFLNASGPAIEGQGGDAQTYRVAAAGVRDFALSEFKTLELMAMYFNPRCIPPWEYNELALKVSNALRYGRRPVGHSSPLVLFDNVFVPNVVGNVDKDLTGELADWIVPSFLARGELTVLVGAGGVGKSGWIATLIAHLMVGKDFGPLRIAKPHGVITYNDEDSNRVQSRRLLAAFQHNNWMLDQAALRHIFIQTQDALGGRNFLTFNRQTGQMEPDYQTLHMLDDWLSKMPYADVIILDPMRNLHTGNENDAAAMNKVLRTLRQEIALRYGVGLLIPHHTGIGEDRQERSRGSSAIEATPRFVYALTGEAESTKLTLTNTKQSFGPRLPRMNMQRVSVELSATANAFTVEFTGMTKAVEAVERSAWLHAIASHMWANGLTKLAHGEATRVIEATVAPGMATGSISNKLREYKQTSYTFSAVTVDGRPVEVTLLWSTDGFIIRELGG